VSGSALTRPAEGRANWLGLWALYLREVKRFAKMFGQTLLAPVVTTLLFLAVFSVAFGGGGRSVAGIPYAQFLAPGLIMMAILQNAFANTSTSLMMAKVNLNIVDTLMPPLSAAELTCGFAMGGATRGIAVALAVALAMSLFVPLGVHSPAIIVFHAFGASLMMSLIGLMAAIWAEKFDQIASIANFVVLPLSFLSGTFYTIQRLPEALQTISLLNPFFYAVDGLRYGFLGYSDGDPLIGAAMVGGADILLWIACHRMFASGYKLKA
jgi:ABC-2 type transport system permease protein